MSQGTRCRQIAEMIVFDSPLMMMCDSPTNYEREAECTRFMASLPTVYDDTRTLEGKIGEYIILLRRDDEGNFYIGAMTDRQARDFSVPLGFLPEGDYTIEEFTDGMNARRQASDYLRRERGVDKDAIVDIRMAPGGGYAAKISRR